MYYMAMSGGCGGPTGTPLASMYTPLASTYTPLVDIYVYICTLLPRDIYPEYHGSGSRHL